jgi:hypothetical protein
MGHCLFDWSNNSAITAVCHDGLQSDQAHCIEYLDCYLFQDCGPGDACAAQDGDCGINKIGGGSQGVMFAANAYNAPGSGC